MEKRKNSRETQGEGIESQNTLASDCSSARQVGETIADDRIAAIADAVKIMPGTVYTGEWTGQWRSRLPLARLFYVFESGPDVGFLADAETHVDLRPGTWAILPPGREIRHCQLPGLDVISIHFRAAFNGGLEPLGGCPLHYGHAPEWRELFLCIANACSSSSNTSSLDEAQRLCGSITLKAVILMALSRAIADEGGDFWKMLHRSENFAPLFEAVAREPLRNFSVADMAATMSLGEMTFAKRFAATMGESPRVWFNRQRAQMAAKMLLDGGKKVRSVAEELGFCDEYYFSRFFKRHFGLSPKSWLANRLPC